MSEPLVPGLLLAERYGLEGVLGQGAMGQVWRCTDLRLEREVAVKLVASELRAGGREQEVRLQREAKAAAILDHPGITAAFSPRDPARAAVLRRQADHELQSMGPQADRVRGAIVAALAQSDSTIAYCTAMEIRDTRLRDAALGTLVELLTEH